MMGVAPLVLFTEEGRVVFVVFMVVLFLLIWAFGNITEKRDKK